MKSMTGFGSARLNENDIEIEIEIKSVNSRYLDLKTYLPRQVCFQIKISRVNGLYLYFYFYIIFIQSGASKTSHAFHSFSFCYFNLSVRCRG